MKTPYILCAALYHEDGKAHPHQPRNIATGFVITGRRHHNCFVIATMMLSAKQRVEYSITQGFLTSDDMFVDRIGAAVIAYEAGQTVEHLTLLCSEDLY